MKLGLSLSLAALRAVAGAPGSETGPFYPAVPAVDLAAGAGSLRLPEGNNAPEATALPTYKGALFQTDTGFSLPASSTPHATFAIVRLPRDKRYVNANFGILGVPGTGGGWRLRYGGDANGIVAERGRFRHYQRSTSGGTVDIQSAPWTEDAALVVAGCDAAGLWSVDWYSLLDGTRVPGPASAVATAAVFPAGSEFAIGANANGTAYADNGVTNRYQWPGEIGAVGVVARAVSVAEWQGIALGADIAATLGGASLRYLRQFDGTPASLTRPAAATADTSVPAQPWGGGTGVPAATLAPGSTLRRQSATAWLRMAEVSAGHVYGLAAGQTERAVPFAGTAGGLTGMVQVRVFEAATGRVVRDWTDVGPIAGGAWSGSVTLPRAEGWWFAQARAGAVLFERRAEFATGWKLVLLGQSQMQIAFGGSGLVPLAAPMTASWATNDFGYLQMARIGMNFVSDGRAAFLNQWRAFDPATPVMLIDEAVNGTGMDQIINSASAEGEINTRNMAQLTRKLAAYGADVSAVIHNWGTNNMALAPAAFQNLLEALFFGTGPAAGDRSLAAELAAGWVPVISPLTRHVGTPVYTGNADTARAAAVAWANANGVTVGPPLSDLRIENGGGPHQTGATVTGIARMMARLAVAAARALGLDPSRNPHFTGATLGGGGTVITVSVALPNGGTLYSPAPAALRSFEVDAGGTGSWTATGFTAALAGNSAVLTKTSGSWPAGTRVRYLSNGEGRADGDGAAEDAILAGALYETWAADTLTGHGLPVLGSLSGGRWVPDWQATCA